MALGPETDPVDPGPETDPADPVVRATRELRRRAEADEAPEGWPAVERTVRQRVRSTVAPADPVLVLGVRDDRGSRTYVSSRVLEASLRRLLRRAPTHAPDRITLRVEDERPSLVEVALTCAYGTDLRALAEEVRSDARALLAETVGVGPVPVPVTVDVVDVVAGDPRRV
ncbi:hypothetical protein [Nocardioides sp. AX2bis]|uniref:hypothetical protein n=1 Tax=Nocardioides sp. AX2bis TaxID=2653157 RepID=UPI0012EF15C4|nr:hypothetical protein [Nocardioides sp. AX2bis]VXC02291.1 conserved hypothetical protein [Nocardioides sp. AX2bis]